MNSIIVEQDLTFPSESEITLVRGMLLGTEKYFLSVENKWEVLNDQMKSHFVREVLKLKKCLLSFHTNFS